MAATLPPPPEITQRALNNDRRFGNECRAGIMATSVKKPGTRPLSWHRGKECNTSTQLRPLRQKYNETAEFK